MRDIVDHIYEAALNAEEWPSVLDRMAAIAGAAGGVIFAAGTARPQWTASAALHEDMVAFVEEGWAARNDRSAAAFRKRLTGFSTDQDTLDPEELERSPIYCGFFRPRGYGWSIGTGIVPLTGDVLVVSLERRYALGPVDPACKAELDPLRPHLARAGLLAARLGLERARATVVSLDMVGLAAAVVTAEGRAVAVNRRLEAATDTASVHAFDRFVLADPTAQAALQAALAALRDSRRSASVMSFPAHRPERPPAVVHVVPLVASGRDIFRQGDAVVMVADVAAGGLVEASLLEALFDLTPAEARVARLVAAGEPRKRVAAALGVSEETVRSHVRSVLRKTGTGGQVELVRLLGSLPQVQSPA